jgi:SulP family sulfate permease
MPYRVTLLAVFGLTVMVDLTVAVEVGLVAACLTFIYRISSLSRSEAVTDLDHPLLVGMEGRVRAFRLYGAVFFGAVKLIEDMEQHLPATALVLDLQNVIYVDSSGIDTLMDLVRNCQRRGVRLLLCGLQHQPLDIARRSGLLRLLPAEDVCPELVTGLALAAAMAGES